MIIRWTVVLALYPFLILAITEPSPHPSTIAFPAASTPSSALPLPSPTAHLVGSKPSQSKGLHPSSKHLLPNGTHHSTPPTRNPAAVTHLPFPDPTVQPGPLGPIPAGHGPNHPPAKGPSVAQIFFEVIGGIAGTVVLLAILRCIYIYRKTPANRYPPTPEVGEIDRTLALLRPTMWRPTLSRPPPPPYQPAPEYAAVIGERNGNGEREVQPPDRTLPEEV